MTTALMFHLGAEDALRSLVSDEELEAAAEATALSYTIQTDSNYGCCS